MSKNIDLGSFSWDISKIEKQIIDNRTQIEQFSVVLKMNKKALEEEKKALEALGVKSAFIKKTQDEVNKKFEQGTISQQEYNDEMEKSTLALKEIETETKKLASAQSIHIKNIIDQEREIKSLREATAELNKLHSAGRTEIQGNEGAYRDLNQELNALKTESKNLGAQLVQLKREGKENTEEYAQLEKQWREVSVQADELNNDFKALDKAVGDNQRSVGDYKDQIVSASSEIMGGLREIASGNIADGVEQISGSFGGLKDAFNSLTTTMMSNPMTAVLVGVTAVATGVGLAVKEFFDYNNQVRELNREVEMLTNHTGAVADEIRRNATAISETYGKDRTEAIKEMNSLMTDFGLSAEQAFETYNKGLADGGAINDEFGDSIREYGVLMAQNGYSAEEFINLLNAGIDLDIYTDKLPDAIKEAGLSLTEQTTATRDALVNAFGQPFTDDLLARVERGQTSVKDALVEISQKSKETNLTLQQQAQLTADVFRGAGEDAGGALKIFEAVNLAHEKEKQQLQGLAKHTAEMAELQRELAQAKDEAMKSDAIQEFSRNMEKMWMKAQIIWYGLVDGITEAVKWIDEVTGFSDTLGETWDAVGDFASELWGLVESLVDVFNDLLSSLGLNNDETKSFVKEVFQALNPLTKLKIMLQGLSTLFKTLSNWINTGKIELSAFGIAVKKMFSQIAGIASSIKNLDFDGALSKLKDFSISKELANARKEAQALNKEVGKVNLPKDNPTPTDGNSPKGNPNAKTLADRQSEANKKADSNTRKTQPKSVANKQKSVDDKEKEMEREAKRSIEIEKEKTKLSIDNAKYELAEYIRINAEKYKDDERITNAKLQDQINYFNEVKRRQLELSDLEEKEKLDSIKRKEDEINKKKALNENDRAELQNLQSERENIEKEYQGKREEINKETSEKIAETEKAHDEKVAEQKKLSKAIEYQQRLLDMETQGATEFEIRQVQLDQETQQKLDAFAKENELKLELDNDNYISQEEIKLARQELENEMKLTDDENEKLRIQNKLDQISIIEAEHAEKSKQIEKAKQDAKLSLMQGAFSGIKSVFGEQTALGKAAAVAETTISTYKAAQEAYANAMKIPVIGLKLAPIMAGIAVASGLKNVHSILSVQTPKAQRGMLLQGKSHAQGGIPIMTPNGMIEAEGGEVIINKVSSQLFRGLLSDINVAGGGVKFAQGGVVGSNLSSIQKSIAPTDNTALVEAVKSAVYEGAIIGTQQGSRSGLNDLNETQNIIRGASF